MFEPYYDRDGITIYHLTNVSFGDNLSLEVMLWTLTRKENLQGCGRLNIVFAKKALKFPENFRGHTKVISKQQTTLTNGKGLAQNIIGGKETKLKQCQEGAVLNAYTKKSLANFVEKKKQIVTIKTAIQKIMRLRTYNFFVENAIWNRMGG